MVILCKSIFFGCKDTALHFRHQSYDNDDFQYVKIPTNGEVAFFVIDVNLCPEKSIENEND